MEINALLSLQRVWFCFFNQAHDCYKIQGKKNMSGNHAISSFVLIHN